MTDQTYDIFIIGGGINGTGIARDAQGRGLNVALAEMGDFAQATSSASTKLFHVGLRYLEFFEINLVKKALKERETLLAAMPHISWPMRFVLPLSPDMRFETETPASKLLNTFMPWMKGRRPDWMIRAGLFMYDSLGGRKVLPGTKTLSLNETREGRVLKGEFKKAFEYSDCWVEDSRLVVLNARDAEDRGAVMLPRTKVLSAERSGDTWRIETDGPDGPATHRARILVNAGGPWVENIVRQTVRLNTSESIRLVQGSHIVTRQLFEHDKAYFFQGEDGRIIFAIPYERDFTLIGTTDRDYDGDPKNVECSEEEKDYLIAFANRYLRDEITKDDIVWTYSGVRPLYDDGATSATSATRDYVLSVDAHGPPVLSVFGGKITTYRRLAEQAMAKLDDHIDDMKPDWTARVALPGGDFPIDGFDALVAEKRQQYPFLDAKWADRLVRAYGTDTRHILGDAKTAEDLGRDFGATLTEAELRWLMDKEYARRAEDVVWRRSKLGLRLDAAQIAAIDTWMQGEGA